MGVSIEPIVVENAERVKWNRLWRTTQNIEEVQDG